MQVLIDPVCILTIYPQLLRNFLYKMPNLLRLTSMLGSIDWMRYVFSRNLMIAEARSPLPISEMVLSGMKPTLSTFSAARVCAPLTALTTWNVEKYCRLASNLPVADCCVQLSS